MITYRKNAQSEWVVSGPVSEVVIGRVLVEKRDRSKKYEQVVRLGQPFNMNGKMMVYGYIGKSAPKAAPVAPKAAVTVPFGSPVYGSSEEQNEMDGEAAMERAINMDEQFGGGDLSGCDVF